MNQNAFLQGNHVLQNIISGAQALLQFLSPRSHVQLFLVLSALLPTTLLVKLVRVADHGVFFAVLADSMDVFNIAELDRRIQIVIDVFIATTL